MILMMAELFIPRVGVLLLARRLGASRRGSAYFLHTAATMRLDRFAAGAVRGRTGRGPLSLSFLSFPIRYVSIAVSEAESEMTVA